MEDAQRPAQMDEQEHHLKRAHALTLAGEFDAALAELDQADRSGRIARSVVKSRL
jgi:hypothetical protein